MWDGSIEQKIIEQKKMTSKEVLTLLKLLIKIRELQKKKRAQSKTAIPSILLDWETAVTIPSGVLILIWGLALAYPLTSRSLGDWIVSQMYFRGNTSYIIFMLVFDIGD